MAEIIYLGKLNTQSLENEFGKLRTNDIIITDERIEHIKLRHPQDYNLFEIYGTSTVLNPDLIIKVTKCPIIIELIRIILLVLKVQ